jgi:hypothetical protein
MLHENNCSEGCVRVILRSADNFRGTYAFIANQIASATITTTIAPQTMGVTFFELPLRGESFGAWL